MNSIFIQSNFFRIFRIGFSVFIFVFCCFFHAGKVHAKEFPTCKGINVDPSLAQACTVGKGKIKLAIPFPGVQPMLYYPIEVRTQPNADGSGMEFCYYQEEKKCYFVADVFEYIKFLYIFLVSAIGIVAVAMIIYGGYWWALARGNSSDIEKAKEIIKDSTAGVIIALLSYVLLYTVNPQITKLAIPGLAPIPKIPSAAEGEKCPWDNQLVAIDGSNPNTTGINVDSGASDPRLMPVALDMLYKAGKIALADGQKITVTSANRTYAKQQELYNCYQTKESTDSCPAGCGDCNEAAKPGCETSPHMKGIAVDACLGSISCSMLKTEYNGKSDLQTTLQNYMKQAGFTRYCGEWWHFEAVKITQSVCEPGAY